MRSTMHRQTDSDAGPVGPANQPRPTSRPRLAPHVRLKFGPARQQHVLPLPRTSVREHPLARIWERSPLFQCFRGTGWMPDPCRSCDRREIDSGGRRCRAFQLTGDAARTDPVCYLSPGHGLVAAAVRAANPRTRPGGTPLVFRPHPDRPIRTGQN